MRDVKVLHGRRRELQDMRRHASRNDLTAVVRWCDRQLAQIDADLRAVRKFGGEAVPMRTPWKRLLGRERYFENL